MNLKCAYLVTEKVHQLKGRVDSNIRVGLPQTVYPFLFGYDVEFDAGCTQGVPHGIPGCLLGRVENMPQWAMAFRVDDLDDGFRSQVDR